MHLSRVEWNKLEGTWVFLHVYIFYEMATCYLQIVDMFAIDETLKSCFWKRESEHELSTSRRKKKQIGMSDELLATLPVEQSI